MYCFKLSVLLFRCECDQLLLRAAVSYLSTYFRRMHSHMTGDQLEQYLEGMELSKTSVIYTLETTKREESIDILIFSIVILLFDLLTQVEKKLEKKPSHLQPIYIDGLVDYSTRAIGPHEVARRAPSPLQVLERWLHSALNF